MDKNSNVKEPITTDYNASCDVTSDFSDYQEIACFSSDELKGLIDNEKNNIDCDCVNNTDGIKLSYDTEEDVKEICNNFNTNDMYNISKYNFRIHLKHSEINEYDIANNLILDNCYKYNCNKDWFCLDGNKFYPNFNIKGVFEDIYAKNSDRTLDFSVSDKVLESTIYNVEDKADTSYGFKLSQIFENVGEITSLNEDKDIETINEYANITFIQKSVIFRKYNRRYILFNFRFKNIGQNKATKVLFKDIFPENVFLIKNALFLNGKSIKDEKVNIQGRRLFVKLNDIDVNEDVNLIIVGLLCENCTTINFGALTYISGYTHKEGIKTINIVQQLSNMKMLKLKGCN